MRDAVGRLIESIVRQIVQHEHGHAALSQQVLQRKQLATIAQRTLGKQTNFGKAIENHQVRIDALDLVQDQLGRFTKFQVRGIEDRLLLVRIEDALGRLHLEDRQFVADRPSMRRCRMDQLIPRFRKGDIEGALFVFGPLQQELESDGCFSCAGASLEEEQAAVGEPTRCYLV